jgi:hypothetical protein
MECGDREAVAVSFVRNSSVAGDHLLNVSEQVVSN